jgi:hypothetical protein
LLTPGYCFIYHSEIPFRKNHIKWNRNFQHHILFMPSATRGALFEKTAPLDPPQKLLIHGQPGLQGFCLRASHSSVSPSPMPAVYQIRVEGFPKRLKQQFPFQFMYNSQLVTGSVDSVKEAFQMARMGLL